MNVITLLRFSFQFHWEGLTGRVVLEEPRRTPLTQSGPSTTGSRKGPPRSVEDTCRVGPPEEGPPRRRPR